jgi:uncharacterized protein (DUF58 family)
VKSERGRFTQPQTGRLRQALAGLTVRGRGFLAAGLTCMAAGIVLDQLDLLRVGVLIAVLPLAAAAFIVRARYRISVQRRVDHGRASVGGIVRAELQISNLSRVSTPLLLAQDALPPELGAAVGGGARFVLERLPGGGQRTVSYAVRPQRRGRYVMGPLSMRLTDPFGFCQLLRTFSTTDCVTVMPETVTLPTGRLGGQWSAGGHSGAPGMSSGDEQDATTRPYRSGDDRRRVHWRTTARAGELMVRREEQPWQSQATLLIDSRRDAHSPGSPSASFEYTVSAVASIAQTLIRGGYDVRLVDDVARVLAQSQLSTGDSGLAIMEALADQQQTTSPSLLPVATRIGGGAAGQLGHEQSSAVVAVLGRITRGDAAALAQAAARNAHCLAVLVDAEVFGVAPASTQTPAAVPLTPSAGALSARDVLRSAGWSVTIAGQSSPLDELWREINAQDPQRLRRWVG